MKKENTQNGLLELQGGHVFRMQSMHDIFRKLYREKRRFDLAGADDEGRQNQVDAALNFAITAWHMTDWVWQRQERDLRVRFGVTCKKAFLNELRHQCPELKVCDVIANAAKHGGTAVGKQYRPKVETVLIAEPIADGGAGVELYAEEADREWSLRIEVDGRSEDPHALFFRVFVFWSRFIQQHCIADQSS